ncbi:hypothetical protein AVP42_00334 [Agromyces sp. NDB4Y10]|uniref:hypothetical protein n=1 Tax=Agromyces sp. NDB4Y10 TaxID=1775951 RepID=UPI0007B1C7F9|nr:hypothetical protein [Agromyces sp. NDB4Y10]KZE95358.1 hypothetical protein AVP42_00334 [Agromyces sp. NDB4Y10]
MARQSKDADAVGRPSGVPPEGERFEATVHPGEREAALARVADLDLDRVPDPQGGVRVVVNADDLAELVRRGYEVRVVRTVPIAPVDPALVASDEEAERWLEDRIAGIPREEER